MDLQCTMILMNWEGIEIFYTESVCGAQDELLFLVVIEKNIVHRLDSSWNCDRKMESALISRLQELWREVLLNVVLSSNKGRHSVSLSASLQASVFIDRWTSGRSPHVLMSWQFFFVKSQFAPHRFVSRGLHEFDFGSLSLVFIDQWTISIILALSFMTVSDSWETERPVNLALLLPQVWDSSAVLLPPILLLVYILDTCLPSPIFWADNENFSLDVFISLWLSLRAFLIGSSWMISRSSWCLGVFHGQFFFDFDWFCLASPCSVEPKDFSRSLRKSLCHLAVISFVFWFVCQIPISSWRFRKNKGGL